MTRIQADSDAGRPSPLRADSLHQVPSLHQVSPGAWLRQPLVVIGSSTSPASTEIANPLHAFGEVFHYAKISEAMAAMEATRTTPGLIVLWEPRRGRMPHAEVSLLRNRFPLARMVLVYGSWCEGETRSGTPFPGLLRVALHRWPFWIEEALVRRRNGLASSLDLLSTSTAEERTQFTSRWVGEARHTGGTVAILTRRYDTYAPLADLLASAGIGASWQQPGNLATTAGIGAVVVDAPRSFAARLCLRTLPLNARHVSSEAEPSTPLAAILPPEWLALPVLVLTDAPRVDEVAAWHAAGAQGVLHRPFEAGELLRWLTDRLDLLGQTRSPNQGRSQAQGRFAA